GRRYHGPPARRPHQTEKQAYFKEPDLDEKRRRELRILAHMCELTATLVGAKRGQVLQKMSAQVPPMGDEFLSKDLRKLKESFEAELARYAGLVEQAKEVYDKVKAMQGGELPAEARDVDALRTQLGLSFIWRLDFAEVFAEKGGFDVVIANPPYVRMEEIKELKTDLKTNYPAVYRGRADLYVYFYHVGLDMLHKNGVLTFISSNKFMRARYGDGLRRLLTQDGTLLTVIDFGDLPIFEATTYPCVLVARNSRPSAGEESVQALNVRSMATLERLADAARHEGWLQPQRTLRSEGWALERPEVLSLMEKLRRGGVPLGEYVGGRFYRGVVTGLNKAFVIDKATRDRLVAEDPRSTEIIKPWLRGRDIKRWKVEWQNLYVLFMLHGVSIRRYPAIEAYLKPFKKRLLKRATSANHEWYELQQPQMGCYAEFEKPKIIWPDIAERCEFAFDDHSSYPDCTLFIVPDTDICLVGILNSNVVEWFYRNVSPKIQHDFLRFKTNYVRQIPIPSAAPVQRVAIEALVRKLLDAKGQGPQAAEWERELNALVYELYGLTEEEIGIIEATGGR
ncbi:MAG: TaqI-like C-terminal specificity domain-containing protein, partial [Chloroflexota bacterium]